MSEKPRSPRVALRRAFAPVALLTLTLAACGDATGGGGGRMVDVGGADALSTTDAQVPEGPDGRPAVPDAGAPPDASDAADARPGPDAAPSPGADATPSPGADATPSPGADAALPPGPDAALPPPDRDGDGIPDTRDTCPDHPDPEQLDADGDGAGDRCDRSPVVFNVRLVRQALLVAGGTAPGPTSTLDSGAGAGRHTAVGARLRLQGRLNP